MQSSSPEELLVPQQKNVLVKCAVRENDPPSRIISLGSFQLFHSNKFVVCSFSLCVIFFRSFDSVSLVEIYIIPVSPKLPDASYEFTQSCSKANVRYHKCRLFDFAQWDFEWKHANGNMELNRTNAIRWRNWTRCIHSLCKRHWATAVQTVFFIQQLPNYNEKHFTAFNFVESKKKSHTHTHISSVWT